MRRTESNFNFELFAAARESRGISQSRLAREASVTQALVSKIESGLTTPSDDTLAKLADVLRFEKSFFCSPERPVSPGTSLMHFRKRKGLPIKEVRQLSAVISIRAVQVKKLLRSVEMKEPRFFRIDLDEPGQSPELAAQMVRAAWGLRDGPVRNLVDVIEDQGAIVIPVWWPGRKFDALSMWYSDSPPLVLMNMNAPADRCRFTIAHELGHLFLHEIPRLNQENEADSFAAEFLMPADQIRPQLRRLSLDMLAHLKRVWGVSMAALIRRAKDLGTISKNQYDYIWRKMGALGFRTQEPVELEPPTEKPSLLREILTTYLTDLGYSIDEIARDILGIEETEFREAFTPERKDLFRIVGG